jgi:hypothetical protein
VRHHRYGLRLRHRGNVHERCNALASADVRIEDVRGAPLERVEELLLGLERLTGDNRDRHRPANLRQELDIVGEARFLVPGNAEFGQALK